MNAKIKWLRDKITRLDMQGMIVSNPMNIRYLIGVEAEGILLLTRKETIFLTDARYLESVNRVITVDDEIIVTNVADVSNDEYENFFLFCENIGFEENYITYAKYKEYIQKYRIPNFIETENMIEKQREIKDEQEISFITKACEITDQCFSYLLTYIQKGRTEKEIALEIERFFIEQGAQGVAFDTIVASGPNSSMPHAVPTQRKIQAGDVITLDFGCKYNGYCSDMTRTIFMEYVPEEIKPIYELVLKNQNCVLQELREGANVRSITKAVENDFKLYGYDLVHALGHSLGLEVHENPIVSSKRDGILKENMVLTDEPGIYLPGKFGVRIEDTVLITKNGCIALTKSAKDYSVIRGS